MKGNKGVKGAKPHCIYLSAAGKRLTQPKVERLVKKDWILLLCGHYEGIDQRVIDGWIDEEISIGDFVLTGGEIPAIYIQNYPDLTQEVVDGRQRLTSLLRFMDNEIPLAR